MGKNRNDDYAPSGRQGEKSRRVSYTIVLACGCSLYYETFPALRPQAGDVTNCNKHMGRTTIVRVE